MSSISARWQAVLARITQACLVATRPVDAVSLLAVSKTFPPEAVREAFLAGQRAFGENYVQEGVAKIAALADLREHIIWHFIGPLQSNKTREVATHFDWVHAIDRLKIAQRLAEQRPAHLPPLQVCIQVNISGEASKSGVSPAEAPALACAIAQLPQLQLRGLMAIPEPVDAPVDSPQARAPFAAMSQIFAQCNSALQEQGIPTTFDTLSMGMSADMESAIYEGATIVRVGTAIFGNRPPL